MPNKITNIRLNSLIIEEKDYSFSGEHVYPEIVYQYLLQKYFKKKPHWVVHAILQTSDKIRNEFFEKRYLDESYYRAIVQLSNLSLSQVELILEDIASGKANEYMGNGDDLGDFFVEYATGDLFQKYFWKIFKNDLIEQSGYFFKLMGPKREIFFDNLFKTLDKDELVEFFSKAYEFHEKNKGYSGNISFRVFLLREKVDETFAERLKERGVSIFLLDGVAHYNQCIFEKRYDEIQKILVNDKKFLAEYYWYENPLILPETLKKVWDNLLKHFSTPEKTIEGYQRVLKNIVAHPNCPPEVHHDMYERFFTEKKIGRKTYDFYDFLNFFVHHAPRDLVLRAFEDYSNWVINAIGFRLLKHPEFYTQISDVVKQKLWNGLSKKFNVGYRNLSKDMLEFWSIAEEHIVSGISIPEMNDESLFGFYIKKLGSSELKNLLFDEIKKRVDECCDDPKKFIALFPMVSLLLRENWDIPQKHLDYFKNVLANVLSNEKFSSMNEDMILQIRKGVLNRFSTTETIYLLSRIKEKQEKPMQDIVMHILEYGNVPSNLIRIFDEEPKWMNVLKNESIIKENSYSQSL